MNKGIELVLSYFEALNAIPRCSGNEAGLAAWLIRWAQLRQYPYRSDKTGNLVIQVPGSPGCEGAPLIVIQGHMDMVCEKRPDAQHDFNKDAIKHVREGDWLRADGTTLGADNGIAIAYAMALCEDEEVSHPPLELLFTVNEETGLTGVQSLDPGLIRGRTLINLDSEDEGVFTIGCAGGRDLILSLQMETQRAPLENMVLELTIGGLIGGHSGIDIGKQRGNANKLMGQILSWIHKKVPFQLIDVKGGSRHNAIPRDAKALISCPESQRTVFERTALEVFHNAQQSLGDADKHANCTIQHSQTGARTCLTHSQTQKLLRFLAALPNGVFAMSATMENMVEASCNLATVDLSDGKLTILMSQRSSDMFRMQQLLECVSGVAALAGAAIAPSSGYPPWEPDLDSKLLKRSQEAYKRLYGRDPTVQIIHAGLECALIGEKVPGMDMISFGPDIRNPHSPDERLSIASAGRVWQFLSSLLATFGRPEN